MHYISSAYRDLSTHLSKGISALPNFFQRENNPVITLISRICTLGAEGARSLIGRVAPLQKQMGPLVQNRYTAIATAILATAGLAYAGVKYYQSRNV